MFERFVVHSIFVVSHSESEEKYILFFIIVEHYSTLGRMHRMFYPLRFIWQFDAQKELSAIVIWYTV